MREEIAQLSPVVVHILGLSDIEANCPIYIGETNREHIKHKHPEVYGKYGKDIPDIVNNPDYVGYASGGSIEFIKEYKIQNEYVKVAVRASGSNALYVRTMYIVHASRVENYIHKGTLIRVK